LAGRLALTSTEVKSVSGSDACLPAAALELCNESPGPRRVVRLGQDVAVVVGSEDK